MFLLVVLAGAGLYFFVYKRGAGEAGPGDPVTLEMRSTQVEKSHGQPAQMHTEKGGRDVWIYDDGRLVEFRNKRVVRSEPPSPGNPWVRQEDGSWVRKKEKLASSRPKGPTPRGSAASLKAREAWGWDRQGTALDQPAK